MADGPSHGRQTLTWALTLIELAQVSASRIVVRTLGSGHAATRRQLDHLGVETIAIQPFATGFPHCNKLRQLDDPRFAGETVTVLTDTDIAFVSPIDDLAATRTISAKVVDLPHPPLSMWRRILETAGLQTEPTLAPTSFGEHVTPAVNRNGGLYVLPGWAVSALAEPWPRWARWLIERPALLPDGYVIHVDQISFGLALLEGGLSLDSLALEDNCPTHVPDLLPNIGPRVLHYHDRVDPSGLLLPVGRPLIDQAIARVNAVIARGQR